MRSKAHLPTLLIPVIMGLFFLTPVEGQQKLDHPNGDPGNEDPDSKELCVQRLASSLQSRDIEKFKAIIHQDFEMIQRDGFRFGHDEAIRATEGVFNSLSKFVAIIGEGKWSPVEITTETSSLPCWETVRGLHYEFTPTRGDNEVQIEDATARIVVTAVEEDNKPRYKLRIFKYLD